MAQDDGTEVKPLIPGVRSIQSQEECFVRFKNCTGSHVEVIWIKYDGSPKVYTAIPPAGDFKVKTYETHPWVFRDKVTHEKLQINSQDVFQPTSFRKIQARSVHPVIAQVSPGFITYNIHYPFYNLKERASQVVLQCLSDPKEAYELEIPVTLRTFVLNTKFRH